MSVDPRGVVDGGNPTGALGKLLCACLVHKMVVVDTRGWFDTVRCVRCGLRGRIPSRG